MFSRYTAVLAALAVFVATVSAAPMPMAEVRSNVTESAREEADGHVQRGVAAFEPIAVYRRAEVNDFPAEQASQSLTGTIEPYNPKAGKRDVNNFPEEKAAQSLDGNVVAYDPSKGGKRSFGRRDEVNNFPAEQASQSLTGTIEPYNPKAGKREVNNFPEEEPAQSLDGNVIAYDPKKGGSRRRDEVNNFPAEQASLGEDGPGSLSSSALSFPFVARLTRRATFPSTHVVA
jgi:hypothetical protein